MGEISRTGKSQLAEDLIQDTFVRAMTHWGDRRDPERTRSWLFTIAHNLLLDNGRRRQIESTIPVPEISALVAPRPFPSPEQVTLDHDRRRTINGIIESLPGQQGDAISLRYLQERTGVEAAEE